MRDQRLVLTLAGLLFAARMSASEPLISYEVSVSDLAARTGLATTARSVATTYGGVIDPRSIDETNGTFVIHIRRGSVALMRADSRIKTVRSVARPPSTESLPPSAWDYAYDGSGNIKEINTDHFRYDLAGRLTSGMVNGTTNKQTFTYDGFGNRTGASRPSGASQCVASTQCEMSAPVETTNTNRLASTQASYDDAGNVTTIDGTYSYTYDALSTLRRAGTRDFIYTPNDERIATISNGTWSWTIRGPANQVLREFTSTGTSTDANWAWTRDHIWRGASLLAEETQTSSGTTVVRHFHLDHLGTPRLVTNGSGQRVGVHDYYPFGTELTSSTSETPSENVRFTGHEWDDIGGDIHALTYMHARYYSAALGRFLSVDPVLPVEAMRSPQLWNRYAYVGNNPLVRVDPTGKVLEFTGSADDLERIRKIADSKLHGYELHIHDGTASLAKIKATGKETKEQRAFRQSLEKVIGDTRTTTIAADSGAKGILVGGWSGKIDPSDMQKFGTDEPTSQSSNLLHEVMEQYGKQVLGMSSYPIAHAYASGEEANASGWTRTSQQAPYLQNGMAIIDETYTRGRMVMDVRTTIDPATSDVVSVTRTQRP